MRHRRLVILVAPLVVIAAAAPRESSGQVRCDACHGELELLRQQVATLEEARTLLVPSDVLEASAHSASACVDCHGRHDTFPHRADARSSSCTDCHGLTEAAWAGGVHGREPLTDCADCHGVHGALDTDALDGPAGALAMRETCQGCHGEESLAPSDPHADSLACVGCHEPHRTRSASEVGAATHVLRLPETCGVCHDSIASIWGEDAHARAVPQLSRAGAARLDRSPGATPPSCTACHGTHRDQDFDEGDLAERVARRCAGCHEDYAESFADSYHGQAGELGSTSVARCHDCHSAHEIHPATDARSTVSEERLLDTCRACHEGATAGFAGFQPHADHRDRARYPHVYWSYHLMTLLLIGVFTVFGVHSALWLGRSALDGLRGASEGVRLDG